MAYTTAMDKKATESHSFLQREGTVYSSFWSSQNKRDTGRSPWSDVLFARASTLAVACAFAQAAIGYDGQISDIVPHTITTPPSLLDSGVQITEASAAVNVYFYGSIVGAIATFFLGNILGRKHNVAIGALLNGIGSIIQTASYGPPSWLAGRAIAGIGSGLNTASSVVWQVEVSDVRMRGYLVLLQLAANAGGGAVAGWVGTAWTDSYGPPTTVSWRLPMGMQLFFVAGLFLLLPMLPESPRWLIRKGRFEQAKTTLATLRNRDISDPVIQQEFDNLVSPTNEYVHTTPREDWRNLKAGISRNKENATKPPRKKWRRAAIGMFLQILAGWSGFTAVKYSLGFFQAATESQALTATLFNVAATIYALGIVATMAFVNPLGRRKGLIMGFSAQGTCCLLCLILMVTTPTSNISEADLDTATKLTYAATAIDIIFCAFAGVVSGLTWLYQVEVNTWTFRLPGSALATAALFIGAATVSFTIPSIINASQDAYYGIFFAVNVLAVAFVYLFCPETGSRSLEWLDDRFSNNLPFFVFRHKDLTRTFLNQADEEGRLEHQPNHMAVIR